jgi:hypothetical protein
MSSMQQALEQLQGTAGKLRFLRVQQAIKVCNWKKIVEKLQYYKASVERWLW